VYCRLRRRVRPIPVDAAHATTSQACQERCGGCSGQRVPSGGSRGRHARTPCVRLPVYPWYQ
jgi:hypothetical protein